MPRTFALPSEACARRSAACSAARTSSCRLCGGMWFGERQALVAPRTPNHAHTHACARVRTHTEEWRCTHVGSGARMNCWMREHAAARGSSCWTGPGPDGCCVRAAARGEPGRCRFGALAGLGLGVGWRAALISPSSTALETPERRAEPSARLFRGLAPSRHTPAAGAATSSPSSTSSASIMAKTGAGPRSLALHARHSSPRLEGSAG